MRNKILTVIGIVAVVGVVLYISGIRMTKADLHISAAAEPLGCITGTLQGETCGGTKLMQTPPLRIQFLRSHLIRKIRCSFSIRAEALESQKGCSTPLLDICSIPTLLLNISSTSNRATLFGALLTLVG